MALTRKRLLLAKIESTYGTDPTPAATDAVLVSALEVQPLQLELKDRELILGYLGNTEMVVGQRLVSVSFDVEIAGSGTAGTAPKWSALMQACGFSETIVSVTSVTYAPISSAFKGVTLYFFADGVRHKVTGCRGTWSMSMETGEIPKISFSFTGIFNAPTDETQPSPTFSNQADPVVVNSANTATLEVHGYAACLSAFSLDLANETPFRQLAGCTQQIMITDRKPEGEVTIEAPTIAAKNYFSAASTQTSGQFSWVHGTTAGNIVTFTAPTCNLGSPEYEDSDGIIMLKLPFMPQPTAAGNDEFTLVLS
jgi:hypothetical protein